MGKISPLTIAVIIVILAIIIPVSIMIAKFSITGKAVSEGEYPPLPKFNFPFKNTLFALLVAMTVIVVAITAKRIQGIRMMSVPMEHEQSPEVKEAVSRAAVKNTLNAYIKASLEKGRSKHDIIDDLEAAGWPKNYVSRYIEHYSKTF